MYDVITLGSATVDVFADTDSELIRIETRTRKEELIAFPLGSKLLMRELVMTTGGGGTNAACCMARLGCRTAFLGKIGVDVNGDHVCSQLESDGVDFIGAREGQTGFSVVLDSIHDDRTILAFKGINDHLHPHDMPSTDSRWLYISSLMGESFGTLLGWISGTASRVALNPSNYQVELGLTTLAPLLARVDILVMNREEACKLLGLDYHESPPVAHLLTRLRTHSRWLAIITDGADGVHVTDGNTYWRGMPASHLVVRETTGAGDAFASTLTAMLIQGEPIREAIHLAMTNAESVLAERGAKQGLLHGAVLRERAGATQRIIDEWVA
jgi:ribokinase